ncbi:hypothetical protein SS1G_09454 [Sclerotinia sclerotiorum 1980 UF-70]|uniref:Uncharacterized protein n=1 Tax=Sclerotinia sclerotiorum (strain ATCC 18683 / 1980 / Ss-1) TaxID=665079 RepID=A7EVU5_SCLS1|nr:hypothetical protein SS1G_09454 [Sclerotinia sclerotiorum 1980 UF-70]
MRSFSQRHLLRWRYPTTGEKRYILPCSD